MASLELVFSWRAPTQTGWSKIKNYQIHWSTNGGHSWTSWKPTGLDRRHGPVSLQCRKRCIFQIRAVNARGGGPGEEALGYRKIVDVVGLRRYLETAISDGYRVTVCDNGAVVRLWRR